MGKVIGRYLVVLLLTSLVGLGIYWFIQKNTAILGLNLPFEEEEHSEEALPFRETEQGEFDESGFSDREEHGMYEESGFIQGIAGILRSLGIITGITIVVVVLQKKERLIFRPRKVQIT